MLHDWKEIFIANMSGAEGIDLAGATVKEEIVEVDVCSDNAQDNDPDECQISVKKEKPEEGPSCFGFPVKQETEVLGRGCIYYLGELTHVKQEGGPMISDDEGLIAGDPTHMKRDDDKMTSNNDDIPTWIKKEEEIILDDDVPTWIKEEEEMILDDDGLTYIKEEPALDNVPTCDFRSVQSGGLKKHIMAKHASKNS